MSPEERWERICADDEAFSRRPEAIWLCEIHKMASDMQDLAESVESHLDSESLADLREAAEEIVRRICAGPQPSVRLAYVNPRLPRRAKKRRA